MKKIIRLTESDLDRIVRRVISESMDDEELDNNLNSLSDKDKIKFAKEIESLRQKREKLKELERVHGKDIEALTYIQKLKDDKESRENPKVYLGVGKHAVTKLPYIIGRSVWRKGVNDFDNKSVYVGSLSKFDGNKDHPEAMKIAIDKMKKKIAKDYPIEEPNWELLKHIKDNMLN